MGMGGVRRSFTTSSGIFMRMGGVERCGDRSKGGRKEGRKEGRKGGREGGREEGTHLTKRSMVVVR